MSSSPPPLRVGFLDFQLDEADKRLLRGGIAVELRPKAFAVLCTLARRAGQLVEKDELLDAVWGHRHVSESVLKTTISQLRTALADDAREPRCIETASRYGYRFIAEVVAAARAMAAPPPAGGHGLVAREDALAQLAAHVDAALQGRRQLVFVAGEAGIGKSTLIDRCVESLRGRALVGLGQCVEQVGGSEPYLPVLEALNAWCSQHAPLVAAMRRVAPTWLVQLPWHLDTGDRHELQREVSGATQDRMLREFGELLDRESAGRPLVLVLEDLHWSDQATVQLLGHLARRRTPAALLVLASFRPADVIAGEHPLADLRHELRLHRLCHEIDLEAFSEAELAAWLAARLHERLQVADVPEDFVRALHRRTEGLPLFAVNLLDELLDTGALRRDAGGWRFPAEAELGVPQSIAGVVDKQIGRLPPDLQRLLGAASVAGVEFGHLALAQVVELDAASVQQQLDHIAVQRHWLRGVGLSTLPDGGVSAAYAFAHALYAQVFYRRLATAQRMQWHRRWADALTRLHGEQVDEIAGELALHGERGGDTAGAMRQYARQAARALARSAPRDALLAARKGLALLVQEPSPAHELALRLQESMALGRLHIVSEPIVGDVCERAAALAEQVPDSPACVPALHGLWWLRFTRGQLPAARVAAARLLARAAESGPPWAEAAGYAAVGMTLAMQGELDEARLHLAAAIDCQGDDDGPSSFVHDPGVAAASYLSVVLWWRGEPTAARAQAAAAVARAEALRHPLSQMLALNMAAAMHHFAGEPGVALELTERLYAVVEQHDLPRGPGSFSWLHGRALVEAGEVARGLAEIDAAEQHCRRTGLLIGLSACALHRAEACARAGRDDDALAAAGAGIAWAAASGEHAFLAPLHLVMAAQHRRRGEPAAAARHHAEALRVAEEQGAAGFIEQARRAADTT